MPAMIRSVWMDRAMARGSFGLLPLTAQIDLALAAEQERQRQAAAAAEAARQIAIREEAAAQAERDRLAEVERQRQVTVQLAEQDRLAEQARQEQAVRDSQAAAERSRQAALDAQQSQYEADAQRMRDQAAAQEAELEASRQAAELQRLLAERAAAGAVGREMPTNVDVSVDASAPGWGQGGFDIGAGLPPGIEDYYGPPGFLSPDPATSSAPVASTGKTFLYGALALAAYLVLKD